MGCATSSEKSVVESHPEEHEGRLTLWDIVREETKTPVTKIYDLCGPVLGKGGMGRVLRAKHKGSGAFYAIKEINVSQAKNDPVFMRMLQNEISIMKHLLHPNIARLQEVYNPDDEDVVYMVLDRCDGGSLEAIWQREDRLSEDFVGMATHQLLSALSYLHAQGVAHRDIKLANLMLSDDTDTAILKLIDFGLAEQFSSKHKASNDYVGTYIYTAPEILKREKHTQAVDMWSVGICIYSLIGGRPPYYNSNEDLCVCAIKYKAYEYPDDPWQKVSSLCKDFIDRCLVKNPKKRITAAEAFRHPWIVKHEPTVPLAEISERNLESIRAFSHTAEFKRVAMEIVAHALEPEELKGLEDKFRALDTAGTGEISLEIFTKHLRKTHLVNQEEAEELFHALDVDGTGTINCLEFVAGCMDRRNVTEKHAKLAFDRLDRRRIGKIELEDIKVFANTDTSVQDLAHTLEDLDRSKHGHLNYRDFRRAMIRSASVHSLATLEDNMSSRCSPTLSRRSYSRQRSRATPQRSVSPSGSCRSAFEVVDTNGATMAELPGKRCCDTLEMAESRESLASKVEELAGGIGRTSSGRDDALDAEEPELDSPYYPATLDNLGLLTRMALAGDSHTSDHEGTAAAAEAGAEAEAEAALPPSLGYREMRRQIS